MTSQWPRRDKSRAGTLLVIVLCTLGLTTARATCDLDVTSPGWKEEIAKRFLPYHQLKTADFRIDDSKKSIFTMFTSAFSHTSYHFHFSSADGGVVAQIDDWKVRSGFNQNLSWRRSHLAACKRLLPHEQGHLDIGEIYARRLAATPVDDLPKGTGPTPELARASLEKQLRKLWACQHAEGQGVQNAYDTATAHGSNLKAQKHWTQLIAACLERAAVKVPSAPAPDSVIIEDGYTSATFD